MIDSVSSKKFRIKDTENSDKKLLENMKLFVTYNQENLIGLLSSAIKITFTSSFPPNPADVNESTANHYFDSNDKMNKLFKQLTSFETTQSPENEANYDIITIYELIHFVLNVLIMRETYLLDETVVSMIINVFKILMLHSEPDKVDLIVRSLAKNLEADYTYLSNTSEYTNNKNGSLILEILLHWIDISMQNGEIGYVTLYVDLISNLNKNSKWKPKVIKFIEFILNSIAVSFESTNLESNSSNCVKQIKKDFTQSKLLNFIYAFNSASVTTGVGQWIEFKNDNRLESCVGLNGLPKSNMDFKVGILKSLFYDGSSNAFSMWSVDPSSRKLINFKELKYNADFRKPNAKSLLRNEIDLYFNRNLVGKLIRLFKLILAKHKPNDLLLADTDSLDKRKHNNNNENNESSTTSSSETLTAKTTSDYQSSNISSATSSTISLLLGGTTGSSTPLKQKMHKYELMHIDRKREVNQIFQQCLPLKSHLLILAIITFVKDYILQKTLKENDLDDDDCIEDHLKQQQQKQQQKENLDSDSETESIHESSRIQTLSEDESDSDQTSSGGGDESLFDFEVINWIAKLSFSNTNMNAYWKVSHLRCYLVSLLLREGFNEIHSESDELNKLTTLPVFVPKKQIRSTKPNETDSNENSTVSTRNHLSEINLLANLDLETKQSQHRQSKDSEQSVDDLKMNLSSLAVMGVCDPTPLSFSLDEMSSSSLDVLQKNSESLSELRNKRSLKLFEDCIDKLVKFEPTPPPPPPQQWNGPSDGNKAKYAMSKLADAYSGAQKPNWLNELTNHMSKYINSHASAAGNQIINKQSDLFQTNNQSLKIGATNRSVFGNCFGQPIKNAIKLVVNSTIVLTARELLILLINWSLKQQQQQKNDEKKLTIMQINCETEFELLQLLDILYYTENSINYRLFIRNLLLSLHSNQKSNHESDSDEICLKKNKILNKISVMACHFMLPEYKLLRKVNWNSDDHTDNDSGKLKNKQSNEPIYEENVNFTSNNLYAASKQANDIENGLNLASKPNDIEKLSTVDSTLLVIFDTSKSGKTIPLLNQNTKPKHVKLNTFINGHKTSKSIKVKLRVKQSTNYLQAIQQTD